VNLSTPQLWWPGALAHVPIWPAGLLRVQGACGSWSKRLALRRRPTLLLALLLAASCCASRSHRRRCYLPHHRSQSQARALFLPSLLPLAPKHQRQNTEPALHSNATQGNQNPAAKQD